MQIQLNGERQEIADQSTVEALIASLDLEPARVAIELNLNVVRRQDWTKTTLHDGDRVEIVHFVGGGSDLWQINRSGCKLIGKQIKRKSLSCQDQHQH